MSKKNLRNKLKIMKNENITLKNQMTLKPLNDSNSNLKYTRGLGYLAFYSNLFKRHLSCSLDVAKRVFRFVSARYWGMSRRKTDARVLKRQKCHISLTQLEYKRSVNLNKTINVNKYRTSVEYFNYWKECKSSKYFKPVFTIVYRKCIFVAYFNECDIAKKYIVEFKGIVFKLKVNFCDQTLLPKYLKLWNLYIMFINTINKIVKPNLPLVSAYEKKIEQCNIIICNDIRPRSLLLTVRKGIGNKLQYLIFSKMHMSHRSTIILKLTNTEFQCPLVMLRNLVEHKTKLNNTQITVYLQKNNKCTMHHKNVDRKLQIRPQMN
ncbi:hypothetical protein AGLY_011191 [Aphis glycines]|uniref:Uncharacterized protein n=1 Tax=Aphis glycines TaxID=307491 RepID=A0A6G0TCX7_APHGL|nr:hypothetical protein AGLY_011191 [Aphis glycines]